jgi:hypothetical protein
MPEKANAILIMRRIGPVPNLKGCPLPAGEDSREPLEWLNDLEALDSHRMAEAQVDGPCVHKPTPPNIVKVGVRTYRRPHGLLSKLESRAVKAAGAILRGRRHGDVTLLPDQSRQ